MKTAVNGKKLIEDAPSLTAEEMVGRRLRAIRLNKGLSLKALSEHSGLNINTLSLIENGKTSPSVSTLQQLANAIGIPIAYFFDSEPELQRIVFTPADDRPKARIGGTLMENLGENLKDNAIQPFLVTMAPGAGSGDCPIVHTGYEFVFCIIGKIEYRINDENFLLNSGDSLVFESHLPHCWKNIGDQPAEIMLVISPADKDEEPGGRHFSLDMQKREINTRIAVVSDDGVNISQHFGRAAYYLVFSIEAGKIISREKRDKLSHQQYRYNYTNNNQMDQNIPDPATNSKHSGMARAIFDCEAVICGGMGLSIYENLKQLNIRPVVTDCLDPESAIQSYIDGKLVDHTEKLH